MIVCGRPEEDIANDESIKLYIARIIAALNIPEAKQEGIRKFLLWEIGYQRGRFSVGKKIISDYGIESEIKELRVHRRKATAIRYRITNHERVLEYEKKYREKHGNKLRAYDRSPMQKKSRSKRDKLKTKLYQAYLKNEKEKEHEKEKEG